jgi:hypothetical protein
MVQYSLHPNLTIKKILDDVFVFDRTSGIVHSFNATGGIMWEKLSSALPFPAIVNELVDEFEVSKETASKDLFDFIQLLETRKLLSIQV